MSSPTDAHTIWHIVPLPTSRITGRNTPKLGKMLSLIDECNCDMVITCYIYVYIYIKINDCWWIGCSTATRATAVAMRGAAGQLLECSDWPNSLAENLRRSHLRPQVQTLQANAACKVWHFLEQIPQRWPPSGNTKHGLRLQRQSQSSWSVRHETNAASSMHVDVKKPLCLFIIF